MPGSTARRPVESWRAASLAAAAGGLAGAGADGVARAASEPVCADSPSGQLLSGARSWSALHDTEEQAAAASPVGRASRESEQTPQRLQSRRLLASQSCLAAHTARPHLCAKKQTLRSQSAPRSHSCVRYLQPRQSMGCGHSGADRPPLHAKNCCLFQCSASFLCHPFADSTHLVG